MGIEFFGTQYTPPPPHAVLNEKKSVPAPRFPKKTACSSYVQPWLVAVGGWRLAAIGGWQLATGGWWRLVVVGGGWWLVIAVWWWLAVFAKAEHKNTATKLGMAVTQCRQDREYRW